MKRKLYTTAIISSPVIAIYGGSPFYIFEKVDLATYLFLILGLSVNVFVVFWIHIGFVFKFPNQSKLVRFLGTYLANVVLRLVFFFIDPIFDVPFDDFAKKYMAYPIMTSVALNAIVMVIVDSIVSSHKRNEAEKQLQNLKFENTEAQKQVLLQQLQPHFLFNTLSVLKSLIAISPNKAEAYVLKLSDFLRYSVQSSSSELVSINKEIDFVKDYIELQKLRFEDAFVYEIAIPKTIGEFLIPVLSLQILVENIFKHNYFTVKNPLHFKIFAQADYLIVNNVKTSIRINPKSETGLANLNKRYLLCCNQQIKINDNESFFEVCIPVINRSA